MKRIMRDARLAARDVFSPSHADMLRDALHGDDGRRWTRWAIVGVFLLWVLAGAAQALAPRCQTSHGAGRTGAVGRICHVVGAMIAAPSPSSRPPAQRNPGAGA